jgi:DNA-directed RNA polymerase specialized sigma24 family protein
LQSNTYALAVKRLSLKGISGLEQVDELMQTVSFEVMKLAFRGFPEQVDAERFFGYLLGIAQNCCNDFNRRQSQEQMRRKAGQEGVDVFQVLDTVKTTNWEHELVEQEILDAETSAIRKEILRFYQQALQETQLPPYQVITYCYAVLLPQLFKKSRNPRFLRQLAKISGRKGGKPSSCYNEETGNLEGKIARDSVILLNFALSAMEGETVEALSREFVELYGMEPLLEEAFAWGQPYQENLEQVYCLPAPKKKKPSQERKAEPGSIGGGLSGAGAAEEKLVKELVITEDFEQNGIKNWPIRRHLLHDTEKWAAKDEEFCKKSVGVAEELYIR